MLFCPLLHSFFPQQEISAYLACRHISTVPPLVSTKSFPTWNWWIHKTRKINVRGKAWVFHPTAHWGDHSQAALSLCPWRWSSCAKMALQLPLPCQGIPGAVTAGRGRHWDRYYCSLAGRKMPTDRTLSVVLCLVDVLQQSLHWSPNSLQPLG